MPLNRLVLATVRKKALRAGVWFRELQASERAIVDLTVRYVERIRSTALAMALGRVLGKVFRALQLRFWGPIEAVGRPLAIRLAAVAEHWGHPTARLWARDQAYARLLGLNARS